jgi:hypothetical protein
MSQDVILLIEEDRIDTEIIRDALSDSTAGPAFKPEEVLYIYRRTQNGLQRRIPIARSNQAGAR